MHRRHQLALSALFFLTVIFTLPACFVQDLGQTSASGATPPSTEPPPSGPSSYTPGPYSGILTSDLSTLNAFTYNMSTGPYLTKTGLSDTSAASLRQYIDDRVNYVIPEISYAEIDTRTTLVDANYNFPPLLAPGFEAVLVMEQLATGLYAYYRSFGILVGFRLMDETVITLSSPRAGLLRIGPGLFDPVYSINPNNPASIANSIQRLAVLNHEARHSDGHSSNLGFQHSNCLPGVGHQPGLVGLPACDNTCNNGAYAVGGAFLTMAANSCPSCTASERNQLLLEAADSNSRLETTATTTCDAVPEGTFNGNSGSAAGLVFKEY